MKQWPIHEIQSAQNESLKSAAKFVQSSASQLKESGMSWCEGLHLFQAMSRWPGINIKQVWAPESLLSHPEFEFSWRAFPMKGELPDRLFVVKDNLFPKISALKAPTGPMMVFDTPGEHADDPTQDLLVIDGVQDPGNVGTLLRTAAAAGIKQVFLGQGSAWAWSEKVLRAGMGAHAHLKFVPSVSAGSKASLVRKTICTSLSHQSQPLFSLDLRTPVVWVFGNEGSGVSDYWLGRSDIQTMIPQAPGVESLNVAASAAVALFEQRRQRASGLCE